jgi:transcriptional regulator of nitric oxide reductase
MAGRIVLLLACLFVMPLVQAELSDSKRALIQELFPSATIIEDKLPDFPVYPVYQLQELLGYAYESIDHSRLQGFAGKPISRTALTAQSRVAANWSADAAACLRERLGRITVAMAMPNTPRGSSERRSE